MKQGFVAVLIGGILLASVSSILAQSPENEIIEGQIYADNWFQLWVNGELIVTDPIEFTPHNVVEVSFPAVYPITYAILAEDFADPQTGLEYDNTRIGDGGLIAAFSDGTVTNGNWQCEAVFTAPLDPACLNNNPAATCQASYRETPDDWFAVNFEDSEWSEASVFAPEEVRPQGDFANYEWGEATFIWSEDLQLDNTILCRLTVNAPADLATVATLDTTSTEATTVVVSNQTQEETIVEESTSTTEPQTTDVQTFSTETVSSDVAVTTEETVVTEDVPANNDNNNPPNQNGNGQQAPPPPRNGNGQGGNGQGGNGQGGNGQGGDGQRPPRPPRP